MDAGTDESRDETGQRTGVRRRIDVAVVAKY